MVFMAAVYEQESVRSLEGRCFMKRKSKALQSKDYAKNRLKLLLTTDKGNCCLETMDELREDISKVVEKYIDIDSSCLEIEFQESGIHNEEGPVISIRIPVRSMDNLSM